MKNLLTLKPNWNAPKHIKALTSFKKFGNAADPSVKKAMEYSLNLPAEPIWLKQTHSTTVLLAHPDNRHKEADASFTDQNNVICAVMTADCLPVFICNKAGTKVAAIHAGWRGLANGIIENTISALNEKEDNLLVWLGPAIGPNHFEVGEEVKRLFVQHHPESVSAFKASSNQKWMANLHQLAINRLQQKDVHQIYKTNLCTYSDHDLFFSYRREGEQTGRMVSMIWIS